MARSTAPGPWRSAIPDARTPTGNLCVKNNVCQSSVRQHQDRQVQPNGWTEWTIADRWIGFKTRVPTQFGIHGTLGHLG